MPVDWKLYPRDWKAVRARVQVRAGDKCEGCGIGNHEMVIRYPDGSRRYLTSTSYDPADDPLGRGRVVKIVCTTAHLCECQPLCGIDEHLKFLCQRCHNTQDAPMRARHASLTRAVRKDAGRGLLMEG